MEIKFIGKNITVTEGIQEHLREKLLKLEKYVPRLVESHTVLKKQKYLLKAEITVFGKDLRIYGEAESKENAYAAIDMACTRVEKQLKKFREKVKSHHKEHGAAAVSPKVRTAEKLNRESRPPKKSPSITRSEDFALTPMSIDEASAQLEMSGDLFLVFLNAVTSRVNVVYKRDDGNHGLIDPKF